VDPFGLGRFLINRLGVDRFLIRIIRQIRANVVVDGFGVCSEQQHLLI
jgi:hypothetical protein